MTPEILIKAEALPKLQAAYNAGTLQAQKPDGAVSCRYAVSCLYRDGNYTCAIGALLSDELATFGDALGLGIKRLMREGGLKVDDEQFFVAVQSAHDYWANSKAMNKYDPTAAAGAAKLEANFRRLIGLDQ